MIKRSILLATASMLLTGPARAWALEAVLDTVDDLPDDLKKEYVERDGKFHLDVKGMKPEAEFTRIQGALNKERKDHGDLKSRITTTLGDRKFEDVVAQLDRIPELEAAAEGKLDDDKINAIVEGRVKTRIAPVERERDTFKAQVGELQGTVGDLTAKEKTRLIHDEIRRAASAAKVLPEALDDALLLADRVFEVREDDNKVVVKDNVGFTPGIEPSVFFTDLQSKRPHWWGPSAGGGSGGSRNDFKGVKNPWTAEGWNMTEQGQIYNTDPSKAEQLAKSAGHAGPLGAKRPQPAK